MSERWMSLPELAGVIGEDAAEKLCRTFGGMPKYVPHDPKPSHPYARIIGMPALARLSAYAGGWHLSLPNLRRPEDEKPRIIALLEEGWPVPRIAEECVVSERWVRVVKAEQRLAQRMRRLPL